MSIEAGIRTVSYEEKLRERAECKRVEEFWKRSRWKNLTKSKRKW